MDKEPSKEAIDWNAPLEAVNRKTGERQNIHQPLKDYNDNPICEGSFAVDDDFIGIWNCFDAWGNSENPEYCDWDIRNRKPPDPELDVLAGAVDDAWVKLPNEWTRETFVQSVTANILDGIQRRGGRIVFDGVPQP